MRIFTEAEWALIKRLATWRDGQPSSMEEFLVAHVFGRESEQAVIIQSQRRCAVLYHAADVPPERRPLDERRFFEMVALLSYLRSSGLIVVLDGRRGAETLHYLHASFDRPQVEGQTIKLNERGDYTSHPETILDKNHRVLFRGTPLEGEVYELVARSLTGTVCVSQALLALIATWGESATETETETETETAPPTTAPIEPAAVPTTQGRPGEQGHAQPEAQRERSRPWRGLLFAAATLASCAALGYLCWCARATSAVVEAAASSVESLAHARESPDHGVLASAGPPVAASAPTSSQASEPKGRPASAETVEARRSTSKGSLAASQQVASPRDAKVLAHAGTKAEPLTAAGSAPSFYGVDISHWNGDFAREIDLIPSLAFAISKATEGTRLRDSEFSRNRQLLRKRKITHGSYHFFLQAEDPVAQAEFFLATIGGVAADDIAPVVDVEEASLPRGVQPEVMHVQVSVLLLLRTLAAKTGRQPILYTDYAFAQRYFQNPAFANYRLWLAEYSSAPPRVPDTWREAGFFIWQKTGSHKVGSSEVDLDVFFGSKPQLLQ